MPTARTMLFVVVDSLLTCTAYWDENRRRGGVGCDLDGLCSWPGRCGRERKREEAILTDRNRTGTKRQKVEVLLVWARWGDCGVERLTARVRDVEGLRS